MSYYYELRVFIRRLFCRHLYVKTTSMTINGFKFKFIAPTGYKICSKCDKLREINTTALIR